MRRRDSGCVAALRWSRRALRRGSGRGSKRRDVVALALQEKRLLLTEDKDFGDLVFRRERAVPGVVLIRIDTDNSKLKAARLAAAIDQYGEGLFGRYMVIERGRFRSRRVWSGL